MKRNIILLIAGLLVGTHLYSQPINPPKGYVFNDSIIPRIDILIDAGNLDLIFTNPESDTEYPATFIFTTPTGSDTLQNIGFRLRGNTSRWSGKKSYKVSFNTYDPEKNFYGLEKMNINGEHNDPSILRAKLCWDMLRYIGVAASRANHVALYINQNYYGVYLNVEHIDEEFTRSRYGDKHGNLYKCLYPADLDYIDTNAEEYKFENDGRRAYELKTNEDYDDYNDLAGLINIINNAPQEEFVCQIKKTFNVSDFLKIAAADVLTGNWDNYSYLKNNFYLYRNPSTGIFEFIPYDLDNTYGVDWFDIDWANRDIYDWSNSDEERPLYDRIMAFTEFRDLFSYYMDWLLDNYFNQAYLFKRIDQIHTMIRPFVLNDPYYPLDYGYQISDFDNSVNITIGAHVKWGLKPFILQRTVSARNQLDINPVKPVVNHLTWNLPDLKENLDIKVLVQDDNPDSIYLMLSKDGGMYQKRLLYDDGNHNDLNPGDDIYGICIEGNDQIWSAEFFVRASDHSGNVEDFPCDPVLVGIPFNSETLVINEFMASNQSIITDNCGEFDDWIEIFNKSPEPVWLGSKFLSDNLSNRDKWKLPYTYLDPGSFILIWADGQEEQGDRHTNFCLDMVKEEIGLFDAPSTGFQLIDRVVYNSQTTDYSYARSVDGGIEWIIATSPTPEKNNYFSTYFQTLYSENSIIVYPNPANGEIIYFNIETSVSLFDIYGKKLLHVTDQNYLTIGSLPPGIYILLFDSGESLKLIRQ